ncbi:MAG TPA: helix-turn-helix domain-containing protein [Kiritimatiellia bacterium]|nr:helix-turn-helix domain-containing protein [Kiritimatiellia bacterium]HRZ13393.1 helix-turn-helix domain-containing protein [Kiritimatiellia bacterium]HSA18967.1 helix-turn-helix domain-containing protein [Kiritimatiellia bacterium]
MNSIELSPTLWRTCRVLAGPTRLRMFGRLCRDPHQSVGEVAAALKIGRSRASQELRRLQARGLLKATRHGRWVRYAPAADPRVPSAKPIVQALRTALARSRPGADAECLRIASALTHPRRLRIAQALLVQPLDFSRLVTETRMPRISLSRHLRHLRARGLVVRKQGVYHFIADPHPLARCLLGLLAETPQR